MTEIVWPDVPRPRTVPDPQPATDEEEPDT
jgi:hypothetical protein